MEQLKFIETLTIEQFKDKTKVDSVEIMKNPHTNKLFFAYGGKTGAVSGSWPLSKPMISLVEGEKTEQNKDGRFFLLHEKAKGAEVIAEF